MERKTALYECHLAAAGKMVPFAGYLLPIQYSGIIAEHNGVRQKAGLFDVSHMGEVRVSGKGAFDYLQNLLSNDFTDLKAGKVRYALMCNEDGGVIDDLLVYKWDEENYLLVINAANREKDVLWMKSKEFGEVQVEDVSDEMSQIALQGPKAKEILLKVTEEGNLPAGYYSFLPEAEIQGIKCLISQTGYTGESGYEIYCSNEDAPRLWYLLLEIGQDVGLLPCGLGARDTLRLEAGMPLYGHELSMEITPFEADLAFAVKMAKADFIGKEALLAKGEPTRKRVGLKVIGRGIVRENELLYVGDEVVGQTTSGTHAPYLGMPIAMALVGQEYSTLGTQMEAEVRDRRILVEVVPLPFYKKD
jgi:glycine cleavage system T protein